MSDNELPHKKVGRKVDNLIMGVILGGAVGSVLGLALAPKKGADTRKFIKKKGEEIIDKGKEAGEKFVRDHRETYESAKYQLDKGRKGGFFRWLFKGKKKDAGSKITHVIDEEK